jgi:hypothetical protein
VFTDKNATPYSVSNPSAFLSSRSILRRQNQNITVTISDLPLDPNYVSQVLATGVVSLNYSSRWMNAISITTTDTNALIAIAALPFVQSVVPVLRAGRADHFSVSPNPNNGEMNFSVSLAEGKTGIIELFDMTGKLARSIHVQPGQKKILLNAAELGEGIYFCRFVVNGEMIGGEKIAVVK